jgi:hypothetical protein
VPEAGNWMDLKFVRCADVRCKLLECWIHSRILKFGAFLYCISLSTKGNTYLDFFKIGVIVTIGKRMMGELISSPLAKIEGAANQHNLHYD